MNKGKQLAAGDRRRVSPVAVGTMLGLVLPMLAQAQQPAEQTGNEPELLEIVVTAQKREQRLQDVGLTVTAFDGDLLANQGVNAVADLAKMVPSLDVTPSPSGSPVYTLRGVGFFDSSLSSAPDVAIYLDQVPLAIPAFSALTAFDLNCCSMKLCLRSLEGTFCRWRFRQSSI